MSDIGQARQNIQIAGAFDDISYLNSKSQENNPLENIVHPTFLHRKLRHQESRRSSLQENDRQEIKPPVAQPVLNPKYSSIQSTPDTDSPPDKSFKRQDANAKLSAATSAYHKELPKTPQETRPNKETSHQVVAKVEPQLKVEPQKVNQVDPQGGRHNPSPFYDLDHSPGIRHAKQNTQLAGTFDDISSSKSQQNKPAENTVHQGIFHRKLKQQESRRSSQESEYQEIKPTVAQSVLNPKHSSIQSTSDTNSPPDQSFKRQDASANLSAVTGVNPKKLPNPPQEIRPNKEASHQAVELQKVEPQKVKPQKVKQVDPQEGRHNHTPFQDLDHGPGIRHAYQSSISDIRQEKQNTQVAGTFDDVVDLNSKSQENKALENMVHPTFLHRILRQQGSRRSSLQENDRQELKPTVAQPTLNPDYSSIYSTSDTDSPPDKSFKHHASAKLSTVTSVNPKEIQNPSRDIGSNQETAHQAIELQKAMQGDPQEGGHSLTPFDDLDLDHNPSIRANSFLSQTNPAGYTHDQGEYTAQWAHNNIYGQRPPNAHFPAKTKDREKEEIEPEEVQPQDVVPNIPSQKMKAVKALVKAKKGRNSEKKTGVGAFLKGALAKLVETDDLSQEDIIIAVMGPTGSGKSTFINIVTGFETGVGHELESCTSKVSNVRLSMPELAYGDLVFVDTPGFDDTNMSDVDILKMVADWLKATYAKNILLSGLLYFHRISDNRMAGTPLKNLRMFEELCGRNSFQNVILATTMWDDIDEETGVAREAELKSKYWRGMLDRNSTTGRFLRTRESAFTLIDPLIAEANTRSSVLLQREMVDMRKKLPATSAGQELFSKMELLVRQREDLLNRIRNEMKRADGDKMVLEPLQEEHESLRINLESTVKEMLRLKLPLGKRLLNMTEKFASKFTFAFFKSMMSKRSSAY